MYSRASSWFEFVLSFLVKQEGFGFRAKWRDWSTSYTRTALSLIEPVNLPPVGVKNDPQPWSQVHLRVSLEASGLTPLRLFCFISSADSRVLKSFKTRSAWLVILGLFVNIYCLKIAIPRLKEARPSNSNISDPIWQSHSYNGAWKLKGLKKLIGLPLKPSLQQ